MCGGESFHIYVTQSSETAKQKHISGFSNRGKGVSKLIILLSSSSSKKSISTASRSTLYVAKGLKDMYEFATARLIIFFSSFKCFVDEFWHMPLSILKMNETTV